MIIENTFTSISEMVDVLFPFLGWMPWLKSKMLKINWDSFTLVQQIRLPILFVTGTKDEIVPFEMSQKLLRACPSVNKEILTVDGGTHNDTYLKAGEVYGQRIKAFLTNCK